MSRSPEDSEELRELIKEVVVKCLGAAVMHQTYRKDGKIGLVYLNPREEALSFLLSIDRPDEPMVWLPGLLEPAPKSEEDVEAAEVKFEIEVSGIIDMDEFRGIFGSD